MYELFIIYFLNPLQNNHNIRSNTFGLIPGHCALLGSNDESLGWNIVANASLFNDCVINKYPDDVQPGFQAPDVILVILNMDEGTLGFKSGVDGTNYGLCLSGLRAFSRNGQKLYPAISVTKQGAEIGIKYMGSSGAAFAYDYINIYHGSIHVLQCHMLLTIGVATMEVLQCHFLYCHSVQVCACACAWACVCVRACVLPYSRF